MLGRTAGCIAGLALLVAPLAGGHLFQPLRRRPPKPVVRVAPPPPAPLPVPVTPGSIFIPAGRYLDLTRDFRAAQIDDIVTIVVNENAAATASGVTNSTRKTAANASVSSLAGPRAATGALANLANLSGNQQIQGTGQTSRNVTLTTTLSARVVGVGPNGTLAIEGSKEVSINSERQLITMRGLVRPEDLATDNSVSSTRVANLQIQVNGKGVVGDAVKRPNILYRLLLGALPF